MRRLAAALIAFTACAEAPTEPVDRVEGDAALSVTTPPLVPCVIFTKDHAPIVPSIDCESNAFGLDVSFAGGGAVIRVDGTDIPTPRGITGFRMGIEAGTGKLTILQWKQGTRVIDQDVLPPGAAGQQKFDVFVKKFTEVTWVGGGKIDVPEDANDLHFLTLNSEL